jgi:hypothetical protein
MAKNQTKEKDTEAKEEKIVRFISRYAQLKIVNKSTYTKEVDGRVVVVPGKSIQFKDGVYETRDKDEIAFLDSHPNCGNTFFRLKAKEESDKAREEKFKTLEQRESELDTREADLKKREMAAKGQEEGAGASAKGIRGTEATKSKEKKPKF